MGGGLFHRKSLGRALWFAATVVLTGFVSSSAADPGNAWNAWNSPHFEGGANTMYSSFSERPKFLDPGRSYSSNEYVFLAQIYEPPLQYHYLKRPYQLTPLTVARMPEVVFVDADGRRIQDAGKAAHTIYRLEIKPGILYQPHPAFAQSPDERNFLYHDIPDTANYRTLSAFEHHATRELTAADYVYQMKRLADPKTHCPIARLLATHIVGFADLREQLSKLRAANAPVDLRAFDMEGVRATGRYTYEIKVKRSYPQFIYWLAMPFFSPMPWEADVFYDQQALKKHNVVLNWYPIGTGAYMLTENNPNLRMVLSRNPNYRKEYYPSEGAPGDAQKGLLVDAGKQIPFINKAIFSLEKENIPYWNKFLQGYYDVSGVSSDSFDQALQVTADGEFELGQLMINKGMRLASVVQATIIYIGFNMQDPVVGGDSERARKLRRALSIAIDMEEFISIFLNGRGVTAQGPIPPGIFGHDEGDNRVNPYTHFIHQGAIKRRPLSDAQRLMEEAGYADGIDAKTGKPLVLYFDTTDAGPDARSFLNWMRKQFAKLKIQLVIRNTDYNRFQQKVRQGNAQIFRWGWNADYPDPENFLFLFYGPNAKVRGGENATNYQNAQFDRLFKQSETMANSEERLVLIDKAVEILRRDAPWIWGFHPKSYSLHHAWLTNVKPNLMGRNSLMYRRIDVDQRSDTITEWNQPTLWPLLFLLAAFVALLIPAIYIHRKSRSRRAIDPAPPTPVS